MKKTLKQILLLTVCFLVSNASYAQTIIDSGSCGENVVWTLYGTGELVIYGTGEMADYKYQDRSPWDSHCAFITTVTIKSGVTSIGESAFSRFTPNNEGYSSFSRLTIPESLISIGYGAFWDCYALTSIFIPENSALTKIENDAFSGCSALSSIALPEAVTTIGAGAFSNCTSLSSFIIPKNVISIGEDAFMGCCSLTSITIPESVTSISNNPFRGCTNLTNIHVEENNAFFDSRDNCNAIIDKATQKLQVGCLSTIIPLSVTSIGAYAFSGCEKLTSITIPSTITSIQGAAFAYCPNLTDITIPENITHIGGWTFYCCTSLTNITIPKSVTTIGSSAFSGCSSLTSITLPESVMSIGHNAFSGCNCLISITCLATTPPSCETSTFNNVPTSSCKLTVLAESIEAYQADNVWKSFTTIVPFIPQCAMPIISYRDGNISFQCETEGATYLCSIVPSDNASELFEVATGEITLTKQYVITAYAKADGYLTSEPTTLTITLSDGDVNGDGEINVTDVTKLVDIILHAGSN